MLRFLLLAVSLSLVSCAADLQVCQFDPAADLAYNVPPNQCPPEPNPCYQDFDGDGFGSANSPVFLTERGAICGDPTDPFKLYQGDPATLTECAFDNDDDDLVLHPEGCYRLTSAGQDCDDDDDGRFPGNPEVCDGLDNDCDEDEEPDFDQEGETPTTFTTFLGDDIVDVDDPTVLSCTPYPSVRFFLRGGGQINGEPLDPTHTEVVLIGGDTVEGVVKLRALVPAFAAGELSGGIAVSVPADEKPGDAGLGFLEQFNPTAPDTQLAAGIVDFELTLDGTLRVPVELPEGVESFNATIAGLFGREPELTGFENLDDFEGGVSPQHVAALSSPWYCCDDEECVTPEPTCPPVQAPPPDNINTPLDFDPDLVSLDTLQVGACTVHGSARFPFLVESLSEVTGGPCNFQGPDAEECLPIYAPIPVGCTTFRLHIEEEDEGEEVR